jgi:peroxiredoxin
MATKNRVRTKHHHHNGQILAMVLIGAGLLVIGVMAFLVLPKPNIAAEAADNRSAIPMQVDFPAPELQITDLNGNPVALEDYLGQTVLLNNWATWCPPCKAEMPTLQAFYDDYRDQDFTIIAIEAGEPVFEVRDFVHQYGLTFPVWPDPTQKALVAFRNSGLPNSYLIDKNGTVRLAWTGAISRGVLDEYVTPIIKEQMWTQK